MTVRYADRQLLRQRRRSPSRRRRGGNLTRHFRLDEDKRWRGPEPFTGEDGVHTHTEPRLPAVFGTEIDASIDTYGKRANAM